MQRNENQTAAQGYESLYPELYYRVQPFILAACDEIDQCGYGAPTREAVRRMSARIYGDVCRLYPELAACGGAARMTAAAAGTDGGTQAQISRYRGGGLLRDILDIWLLNEIFNRRRRY